MGDKRFLFYISLAFFTGFLLLASVQYSSISNIHNLLTGNRKITQELSTGNRLRGLEEDIISAESKIRETVTTGDTSYLANVGAQIADAEARLDTLRNENKDSAKVINDSGRNAQRWGIVLILLVLVGGTGLFVFIARKIRRQNELILLLDESEKKVRETSRIKDNFMANMSHEIRTPMNAILGFTGLLADKKLDGESTEFVHAIQSSGESLLCIVNDILDLSKIESGMMRIESAPFSIQGLFQSVTTLFSERVRGKGLTLKVEIEPSLPDTLEGDATRLTQILVNLIGNAIKFTETGIILVSVVNKGIRGNRLDLGISVSDTGIGIEKHQMEGIFERFRQAEDSTVRRYGGTGLGLAIVRQLILLQNGNIEVDSLPGKGSTFRLIIPYRIAVDQLRPVHADH